MIGTFAHKLQLIVPSLPILGIALLMIFDYEISKVRLQKMAKCLFYYTLLRSFGSLLVFLYGILQRVRGGPSGGGVLIAINMAVEVLTVYWTLQVLRLTNQDLIWSSRKMSLTGAEDVSAENC